MNPSPPSTGMRTRLTIAAVLAVCAVGLAAAEHFTGPEKVERPPRAERETIRLVVESVLVRSGVERKTLKTWHVHARGDDGVRTEQQVIVSHDFVTVRFNHELSRELAPYGARVVASERTKERTVTMHIVSDGTIIHSLSLVTR